MGPLQALAKAYEDRRRWTLELPHLGYPEAKRGEFYGSIFPPSPIRDFSSKTKDPNIICLELPDEDGVVRLIPLAGPASWTAMKRIVDYLVAMWAHPLDITVATWSKDTGNFTFRTAVDHLLWTVDDQLDLDNH